MVDFKKLKEQKTVKAFAAEIQEKTQKQSYVDARYWKLTIDKKTGEGEADIRFLPITLKDGDLAPDIVLMRSHAFLGPVGPSGKAQWYINKSPVTIGQRDPVYEYSKVLFDSGFGTHDEIARHLKLTKQTLRLQKKYIANILVLKDPANPDNNGKVFLYEFGPQIFSILEAVSKETDPEEQLAPFSPWEGATFKLRAARTKGDKAPSSYERSKFASKSVLFGGDESKLETVLNAVHSLAAEIAPDKFKSYDDLKKQMENVLLFSAESKAKAAMVQTRKPALEVDDEEDDDVAPIPQHANVDDDDDDDDEEYADFRDLSVK